MPESLERTRLIEHIKGELDKALRIVRELELEIALDGLNVPIRQTLNYQEFYPLGKGEIGFKSSVLDFLKKTYKDAKGTFREKGKNSGVYEGKDANGETIIYIEEAIIESRMIMNDPAVKRGYEMYTNDKGISGMLEVSKSLPGKRFSEIRNFLMEYGEGKIENTKNNESENLDNETQDLENNTFEEESSLEIPNHHDNGYIPEQGYIDIKDTPKAPEIIETKDPLPADFTIPEEGIIHLIGGRKFRLKNGSYEEWDQTENSWKIIDKKVYEDRAKGIVKGLYESIDPDYDPVDFDFIDYIDKEEGKIIITTLATPKKGGNTAQFIRIYVPGENLLELSEAFMNKVPSWITDVKIPFIEGSGTPTQAYLTLRQMKLMDIAPQSLTKAKLSTVQNAETLLYITKMMNDANAPAFEFSKIDLSNLSNINSNRYVKTTLTLAGYEITKTNIVNKYTDIITIREAIEYYKVQYLTDDLIKKYGFTYDSEIYINFDVYFDLKPIE